MANQHSPQTQTESQRSNELERARLAVDPIVSIEQLATLLARDPNDPEAIALLERTLPRVSPAALRQRSQMSGGSFAIAAIEAYALALTGRFTQAFVQLAEVLRAQPQVAYFSWLDRWLAANRETLDANAAEIIGAHSVAFIRGLPDLDAAPPSVTGNLQALANFLAQLEARELGGERLPFALSLALRRLRRWPEAKAVSRKWFEASPSWFSAVEAGNAHREAMDLEAASSFYEHAIELDPSESSARLDRADVLLDRGLFEVAAEAYEALASTSEHRAWAEPSSWFARWLSTGDVSWREKLMTNARSPSGSDRTRELARYFSYAESTLPPVFDHGLRPSFDLVARLTATPPQLRPSAPFRINVHTTVPEAPSVGVAFAAAIAQLGVHCELRSSFEGVPEPDPRVPRASVPFLLWRWDEHGARPALESPAAHVAQAVRELASSTYQLEAWRLSAQRLARSLGSSATRDLLACMVHPTPAPTRDTVTWLRRTQVAAALVLAQLTEDNGGVVDGALRSALEGPADWSVGAAAIALSTVARARDDAAREHARAWLQQVLNGAPPGAFWTCEYTVAAALLFILEAPSESRRALWCRLRLLERMYGA